MIILRHNDVMVVKFNKHLSLQVHIYHIQASHNPDSIKMPYHLPNNNEIKYLGRGMTEERAVSEAITGARPAHVAPSDPLSGITAAQCASRLRRSSSSLSVILLISLIRVAKSTCASFVHEKGI